MEFGQDLKLKKKIWNWKNEMKKHSTKKIGKKNLKAWKKFEEKNLRKNSKTNQKNKKKKNR